MHEAHVSGCATGLRTGAGINGSDISKAPAELEIGAFKAALAEAESAAARAVARKESNQFKALQLKVKVQLKS